MNELIYFKAHTDIQIDELDGEMVGGRNGWIDGWIRYYKAHTDRYTKWMDGWMNE